MTTHGKIAVVTGKYLSDIQIAPAVYTAVHTATISSAIAIDTTR